ncbi:MAG TPA: hypothetical protein VJR89_38225, partial [Polyangiales bacterium]|nr:hypothetical protein [Polyangiales bacterium]
LAESYVRRAGEVPLADLCFSANVARQHFRCRAAFVAASASELQRALERFTPQVWTVRPRLAFVFAGAGAARSGAHELYAREPAFRSAFDAACARLEVAPDLPDSSDEDIARGLALAYAQWAYLQQLGVAADHVTGIGIGEQLAACATGRLPWSALRQSSVHDEPAELDRISTALDADVVCVVGARHLPEPSAWLRLEPCYDALLPALAALYTAGIAIDWRAFDAPFVRHKRDVPLYPFQRKRHWLDPSAEPLSPAPAQTAHPLLRMATRRTT